jgi:hypothetical protein
LKFTNPNSPFYGITEPQAPIRYDFSTDDPATQGFSDHLPVVAKFKIR